MTWLFHITLEYHFLPKIPRFPFSNLGQLHLQLSSLMHGRTLLTNLRRQMRVSEALDQTLRGPLMNALMLLAKSGNHIGNVVFLVYGIFLFPFKAHAHNNSSLGCKIWAWVPGLSQSYRFRQHGSDPQSSECLAPF